jgi:DNA-binding MarR family transcriptional regulator
LAPRRRVEGRAVTAAVGASGTGEASAQRSWTFLTNHAHVLACVARDPGTRVRDLAVAVGITERAAQRIVADLVAAGYLERSRVGRRNVYRVRRDRPLRHPLDAGRAVGDLLDALGAG